jgi:8-amino-7-oxononanoate synthase
MRDEPQRQRRVRDLAARVRAQLAAAGLVIPPGDSPIIPIILGDAQAALDASAMLRSQGLFVPAVRPPTVAKAASRLRVTLCSDHTDEMIGRLIDALGALHCERTPARKD